MNLTQYLSLCSFFTVFMPYNIFYSKLVYAGSAALVLSKYIAETFFFVYLSMELSLESISKKMLPENFFLFF